LNKKPRRWPGGFCQAYRIAFLLPVPAIATAFETRAALSSGVSRKFFIHWLERRGTALAVFIFFAAARASICADTEAGVPATGHLHPAWSGTYSVRRNAIN
jgi:hypothetical protein